MVGGIDKYFQIARAYRDEDPRADRVAEHTQLDVEMTFCEREDVMALIEDLYTKVIERFSTKPLLAKPWPRLTFAEAMRRFGSDKPDLRFGMELVDLTDAVRGTGFAVFRDAAAAGGVVRGIVVPGKAGATRKEVDVWAEVARRYGAKGLATFAFAGSEVRSPVAKFLSSDELAALRSASGGRDGDLLLAIADRERVAARSSQYDFALDGRETAGGSIRIHQRAIQERVFELMGVPKNEAAERFGALLDALEYGAPPEGGFAGGIERVVMTLAGTENIREVQAFPKTQTGYDPLLDAPAALDQASLDELGLRVAARPRS
jgi:aspartyl-tRNA synthetase